MLINFSVYIICLTAEDAEEMLNSFSFELRVIPQSATEDSQRFDYWKNIVIDLISVGWVPPLGGQEGAQANHQIN